MRLSYIGIILVLFTVIIIPFSHSYNNGVLVINFNSTVDPGAVNFFNDAFKYAEQNSIKYVIIDMNTPGGYLDSMLSIVNYTAMAEQDNITVITYVPYGGMAASAGSYIAMSSDYIFMANGTFIGPSTPIVEGGTQLEQQHVENAMLSLMISFAEKFHRNVSAVESMVLNNTAYTAQQAYSVGIINGIYSSMSGVLRYFNIQNSSVINVYPSGYDQFLSIISNPTVDGLLITLGMLMILLDLYHFTALLTVVGIITIMLGLWGAGLIDGNIFGIILLFIAGGLILIEVKAGHGIFMISGALLAVLGIYFLAQGIEYSPSVFGITSYILWGILIGVAIVSAIYLNWLRKTIKTEPKTGPEALIGTEGFAIDDLNPEGQINIDGIIWKARSENNDKIEKNSKVMVVGRDNLTLIVKKV
ncbi:MAG: NfeD family protein [Thermoplasmata archaeon]